MLLLNSEVHMKSLIFLIVSTLFIGGLFVACGTSGTGGSTFTSVAATSTCSTGYVYSATYGCLSQGNCPAGYGSYNGTCAVASSTMGYGTYGTTGYGTTGYYYGN